MSLTAPLPRSVVPVRVPSAPVHSFEHVPREALPVAPDRRTAFRRRALICMLLNLGWTAAVAAVGLIALSSVGLALVQAGGVAQGTSPAFKLGDFLDFRQDGNAAPYLTRGWRTADAAGRMSDGALAEITLPAPIAKGGLVLTVTGAPVFAGGESEFWIDILVNGTAAGRWEMREGSTNRFFAMLIAGVPADMAAPGGSVRISFVIGADRTGNDTWGTTGFKIEALQLTKA